MGEEMTRLLSQTFRSLKCHHTPSHKYSSSSSSSRTSSKPSSSSLRTSSKASSSWLVYLIISTNKPIKTYVGVTTNFSRRLKQHNGELKGGAKASRAGRPWICACIIQGFKDQNEACGFESKWKSFSRKLPRKRKTGDMAEEANNGSVELLQHRQAALNKLKGLFDFSHLDIEWKLNPS